MNNFQKRVLNYALAYAEMGWAVLPTSKGNKRPLNPGGSRKASKDPNQIRSWWENNPSANVGVATGDISGIWVLDIDIKDGKNGLQSIVNKFEERFEFDSNQLIQKTATGGLHFIFKLPEDGSIEIRNKQGVIEGVDIRGDGGYVVMPPSSMNINDAWTEYRFKKPMGQALDAPEWAMELALSNDGVSQGGKLDVGNVINGMTRGERDTGLFKFACLLRQRNIPKPLAEAFVLAAAEKCNPPFDDMTAIEKVEQAYSYQNKPSSDFIDEIRQLRKKNNNKEA